MKARCEKQARDPMKVEREIGRMLGKNSRAAKLFDVKVTKTNKDAACIEWSNVEATRDWTTLSAGWYLLRTNVVDWSDEELWKAYIPLTEAEAAFRLQKSDLSIRPICPRSIRWMSSCRKNLVWRSALAAFPNRLITNKSRLKKIIDLATMG